MTGQVRMRGTILGPLSPYGSRTIGFSDSDFGLGLHMRRARGLLARGLQFPGRCD